MELVKELMFYDTPDTDCFTCCLADSRAMVSSNENTKHNQCADCVVNIVVSLSNSTFASSSYVLFSGGVTSTRSLHRLLFSIKFVIGLVFICPTAD